jgi:hypothetical protein
VYLQVLHGFCLKRHKNDEKSVKNDKKWLKMTKKWPFFMIFRLFYVILCFQISPLKAHFIILDPKNDQKWPKMTKNDTLSHLMYYVCIFNVCNYTLNNNALKAYSYLMYINVHWCTCKNDLKTCRNVIFWHFLTQMMIFLFDLKSIFSFFTNVINISPILVYFWHRF